MRLASECSLLTEATGALQDDKRAVDKPMDPPVCGGDAASLGRAARIPSWTRGWRDVSSSGAYMALRVQAAHSAGPFANDSRASPQESIWRATVAVDVKFYAAFVADCDVPAPRTQLVVRETVLRHC